MQNKIREFWLKERPQWILWVPVFFGLGCGLYFRLHAEPELWQPLMIAILAMVVAALTAWRKLWWIAVPAVLVMLVAGGMAIATQRTASIAAPILYSELWPRTVVGTVETITYQPDKTRLVLSDVMMEHISPDTTPHKATLSLRGTDYALAIGDEIEAYAGFFPPPKPAFPEGFQFNRHFFFKQIGAVGYGVGNNAISRITPTNEQGSVRDIINTWRFTLAEELRREMGEREGAVAAALTMGDGKSIPEEVREAMRAAGLAHVLAISGMHLGLVAGILFFLIRFVLVCLPGFALHRNAKKWAAFIALFGAAGYLAMAGFPISAQRAYVMVALVLLAVLLDRFVSPLRSLALAAMLILIIMPEAILTPSFQLSFAATLGILAYYEQWRVKQFQENAEPKMGFGWKLRRFWGGIIITSVLATGATLPFILHHFDSFPTFSLAGNLLVLPLLSFVIMPLIVALLAFMPLGLHGWLFPPLKAAIGLMLDAATWVANWPLAELVLPPLSTSGLLVVVAGGLWLCLWRERWRHAGWPVMVAGLVSIAFYQPPDVILSNDGKKLALRVGVHAAIMLHGRSAGFTQDQWLRYMQVHAFDRLSEHKDAPITCDELGCVYDYEGVKLAISTHRAGVNADCRRADLVLTPEWTVFDRTPCRAQLFDRSWLEHQEGAALWLAQGTWRYETVRQHLGTRPWNP